MRRRTKLIAAGVGLAIVAGGAWALRPKPVAVDTAEIARGALRVTVDADGRTRVRDRYVVAAPVTGRLRRIGLREGDAVRPGTVLAWIAPLPLDVATLRQGRARVDAAVARRREAEGRVLEAREAAAHAARVAQRREAVFAAGGVSQEERDRAVLERRSREEELRAAQAGLRAAAAEVEAASAALVAAGGDGQARADVPVRSPCGGRVLRTPEQSERVVAAGTPLLELGNPRALEIVVDVLSEDAVRLRPGQRAELVDWGGDRPLAARVRRVGAAAVTKLSALGVEEQRVDVVLDPDDPPPTLGDGFRVEARMIVSEAADVVLAPASALVRRGTGWGLFVVDGGRARLRAVELGERAGAAAELRRGPAIGTRVIVYPSDAIADGVRVASP